MLEFTVMEVPHAQLVTQAHSGLSRDPDLMELVRLPVGGTIEWLCLADLQQ